MERAAQISDCGKYRYSLTRSWDLDLPTVLFICLNPSTADAEKDDPTVRRCVGFAKEWGCGRIVMGNLFAFRATHPRDMMAAEDPVGPENNQTLLALSTHSYMTIAAWGSLGWYRERDCQVYPLLQSPQHLGLTKEGLPRHPLYLRSNSIPRPFPPPPGAYRKVIVGDPELIKELADAENGTIKLASAPAHPGAG